MRHIENPGIIRTVLFWHLQAHSGAFSNTQPSSGILRHIQALLWHNVPYSYIFRILCPSLHNRAIFRTMAYVEPEASSEACQICKMIRHIQSHDINRTVYSSTFKDIYGYSGVLMDIQPH